MSVNHVPDGVATADVRLSTVPVNEALSAWSQIDHGWPVECSAEWLSAEDRRITHDHFVLVARIGSRVTAAANVLMLRGDEVRVGYDVAGLLRENLKSSSGDSEVSAHLLRQITAEFRPATTLPCLAVTTTGAVQPGLIWDRDVPAPERDRSLNALIGALKSNPSAKSVVVHTVPDTPDWAPLREALEQVDAVGLVDRPLAELDIPSGGIDEWLEGFSKHSRKNFRKEMREFRAHVQEVELLGPAHLTAPEIVKLQHEKYRKYGNEATITSTHERLQRGARLPGMTVQVARRGQRTVAFTGFLRDRQSRRLVTRFSGTAPNDFYAYFNMSYYERITLGAQSGFSRLSLGPEAYDAKLLRGATLISTSSYVISGCGGDRQRLQEAATLRDSLLTAELKRAARGASLEAVAGGWRLSGRQP